MSELRLNDNPSIETQIALMGKAINQLLEDTRDIKLAQGATTTEVTRLSGLQETQNGNVARLQRRMDVHDDWHGEEDDRIAKRVHEEEVKQARRNGKEEGVKTILGLEYKIVAWAGGSGVGGLLVGRLVHMLGVW